MAFLNEDPGNACFCALEYCYANLCEIGTVLLLSKRHACADVYRQLLIQGYKDVRTCANIVPS